MAQMFAGLLIDFGTAWLDVTDDLNSSIPTLARADGVGAVQFTTASYTGGPPPNIQLQDLQEMIDSLANANGLQLDHLDCSTSSLNCVGGISANTDLTGVWYLSDGTSVALITYCGPGSDNAAALELAEVTAMIDSAEFAPQ